LSAVNILRWSHPPFITVSTVPYFSI
jgi:hypothetical protein